MFREQIRPVLVSFLILTIITGVIYPLAVTGIAQVLFPHQANGSLIYHQGRIVGSTLIGQPFDDPKYFWGRLSATSPFGYNAATSSGSNLGPSNPALVSAVQARLKALHDADPGSLNPVPVDLVTASASGLDPHLSPAGVFYQVPRVARSRGLAEDVVKRVVELHTTARFLGIIGEPVVNILQVNLTLDEMGPLPKGEGE
jgi:potassium-transporting ATPase KdpC subunit